MATIKQTCLVELKVRIQVSILPKLTLRNSMSSTAELRHLGPKLIFGSVLIFISTQSKMKFLVDFIANFLRIFDNSVELES